ncbi:MAG TPA: hypothetical protein VMI75_27020 [Polyangiaceae bacterium]|nr:hypothetical protein [Polyangiaceae bacterium]
MRIRLLFFLVLGACALGCSSSGGSVPEGACTPSDPSCNPTTDAGHDASAAADGAGNGMDGSGDSAAPCEPTEDDAGLFHGCRQGGMGPGDQDDGGDAGPPPPPDASHDASDLPLGSPCWDSAQCASGICFDYAVKGTFCTKFCSTNADCPTPPFMGCNAMGVCRMP